MPPMTWILVAHRAGARLYSTSGKHQPVQLVEKILHPEGRLRNQDIDEDSGGRSFDRLGEQRHTMGSAEEPIEHVADVFVKALAERLRAGRIDGDCDEIVLVAGPRLLGKLRLALDPSTANLVIRGLDKDFGEHFDHELPAILSKALAL